MTLILRVVIMRLLSICRVGVGLVRVIYGEENRLERG